MYECEHTVQQLLSTTLLSIDRIQLRAFLVNTENVKMKQISLKDTKDANKTRINIPAVLPSDANWKTIDSNLLYDEEKHDLTMYDFSTIYRISEYVRSGYCVFPTILVHSFI